MPFLPYSMLPTGISEALLYTSFRWLSQAKLLKMERSQEVRGCDRSRHLSKTDSGNIMVLETPKVPPMYRLGHLGLKTLIFCSMCSRGTEPTQCSYLKGSTRLSFLHSGLGSPTVAICTLKRLRTQELQFARLVLKPDKFLESHWSSI